MTKLIWLLCFSACAGAITELALMHKENGKTQVFSERPIHWRFDCHFPAEYKKLVREGFAYWDQLVGYDLLSEEKGCESGLLGIPLIVSLRAVHFEADGRTALATTSRLYNLRGVVSAKIILYKEFTEYDEGTQISVIRHELGHVLGFDHTKEDGCLMSPYIHDVQQRMSGYWPPKNLCRSELHLFRLYYGQ